MDFSQKNNPKMGMLSELLDADRELTQNGENLKYDIIDEAEGVAHNTDYGIIGSLDNNHPRNRALEATIQRCIRAEKAIFTDDDLGQFARRIRPETGWYDVVLHGNPEYAEFFGEKVTPEIVANVIRRRKDYTGQKVRLLSCSTGRALLRKDCFAQKLAKLLGVKVKAPNTTLWVFPSGRIAIGKTSRSHEGKMLIFLPEGVVTDDAD